MAGLCVISNIIVIIMNLWNRRFSVKRTLTLRSFRAPTIRSVTPLGMPLAAAGAAAIAGIDMDGGRAALENQERPLKLSIPRDWHRVLGRWVARAFVCAAAAAARREGHVEPLSQSSDRKFSRAM